MALVQKFFFTWVSDTGFCESLV